MDEGLRIPTWTIYAHYHAKIMKRDVTIGALAAPYSLEDMPGSAVPGVPGFWLGLSLVHARSFGSGIYKSPCNLMECGDAFPTRTLGLSLPLTGDSPPPQIPTMPADSGTAGVEDQTARHQEAELQRKLRSRQCRGWKCPHCDQAFKKREHMVRHIRSHTKERPFACDICSKSYGRR